MKEFLQFTLAVTVTSAVGFPVFFAVIENARDEVAFSAAEKVRRTPALQACAQEFSSCAGALIKVRPGPRWQGWSCNGKECLVIVGMGGDEPNTISWGAQLRRSLREGENDAFLARWEWIVFPDGQKVLFSETSTTVPAWQTAAAEFVRQQYVPVP